jgi:hypothetical protein
MRRGIAAAIAACVVGGTVAAFLTRDHHAPMLGRLVRLSAPSATDVSRAPGPQSEAAVAVDPRHSDVAVAGSNDIGARTMRVYSTVDGGSRWSSQALPVPTRTLCATSDPSVGVDGDGRQFYSFLGIYCRHEHVTTRIYLATRRSPKSRWKALPLAVEQTSATTLADDRPSITVDTGATSPHRGRLYIGWTRFAIRRLGFWIDPDAGDVDLVDVKAVVSHSDDHGRHWARPTVLSDIGDPLEVRLATTRRGTVYATWRDAKTNAIYVASSPDGSTFGTPQLVAPAVVRPEQSCHTFRARIPAQPKRCVSPNPVVAVDASSGPRSGRVYVVWGSTSLNESQDVYVAAFDPNLHPLLGVGHVKQVNPPEGIRGPDQFLPTAAVDPATGRLWACYYQTLGRARRRSRFTCTASDDGGRSWFAPVAATTITSNESHRPANIANGFGDYEAVAPMAGGVLAAWTDGRDLRSRGEEIYSAELTARTGRSP